MSYRLILPTVAPEGAEISPPATNALKIALALLAIVASVDALNVVPVLHFQTGSA